MNALVFDLGNPEFGVRRKLVFGNPSEIPD
jgi:hypothetical protein